MNRAVQYREFGGPEVLELDQVADVSPRDGEVRLTVRAAGLNPVDAKSIEGQFPIRQLETINLVRHPTRWFGRGSARFPRVLGRDFAGVVDAIGDGVSGFTVGEPVLGTLRIAPGDGATRGSLITQLVAPASEVIHKPEPLGFDVAAALGVAAQTACGALRTLDVGSGDVLVISGASGSVGSLATQLAVHRGATVIGIGGEPAASYLRGLGAIPVSYGGDVATEIRDATPEAPTKFLDCFGGDYVKLAVGLGVPADRVGTLVPSPAAILRGAHFTGSRHAQPGDLDLVADMVAAGKIDVKVANRVPFEVESVRAACAELLNGHVRGKIVVEMA